jgi:hypothetical protein
MTATSENHTCELSTMGTFQYVSVKKFHKCFEATKGNLRAGEHQT